MCGYCHAMTAGEAEDFYAKLKSGTASGTSAYVHGHVAPRSDLQHRQREELAAGAFEDAPEFRQDLLNLVDQAFESSSAFERALVAMREAHNRPVLSDEEVDDLFARRDEIRAGHEVGTAAPALTKKKGIVERFLESLNR